MNDNSNLDESSEQDERMLCAKCGSIPEDILILSCDHNLCTNCALKIMQRNAYNAAEQSKIIKCEICGRHTQIDDTSLDALMKNVNVSVINKSSASLEQDASLSYLSAGQRYCEQHNEEAAIYYCIECKSNPICSECVVHGIHKGHNVVLIKKANKMFKDKIYEKLTELECSTREMDMKCTELEDKKSHSTKEYNYTKGEVSGIFAQIREMLQKSENSIMQEIEAKYQRYNTDITAIIETQRAIYGNKLASIAKYQECAKKELNLLEVWDDINSEATKEPGPILPEEPKFQYNKDTINNLLLAVQKIDRPIAEVTHLVKNQKYLSPRFPREDNEIDSSVASKSYQKMGNNFSKVFTDSKKDTARRLLTAKFH